MRTLRQTLRNYPNAGGLVNSGGQASIPEVGFWETENCTSDYDGRIRKRPGVRQWGQTLKEPKPLGLRYTELFNDMSHFDVDDTLAGGNVVWNNNEGVLHLETLVASAGVNSLKVERRLQPADGTPTGGTDSGQQSVRFLFKSPGMPAQDGAANERGLSIIIREDGTAVRQFLILNDGVYFRNNVLNFVKLDNTDVDDNRWHVIEIRVASTLGTVVIDEGTPVTASPLGDVSGIAITTADANQFEFRAFTNSNGAYIADIDFVMGRSSSSTPFVGSLVTNIADWNTVNPSRRQLLVAAGTTLYRDTDHTGIFKSLDDIVGDGDTELVPFFGDMVIMHPTRPLRSWGGSLVPAPIVGSPMGRLGTEHQGSLFTTTDALPLRVYFSGPFDLSDWTTAEGGTFTTSGFFDIPDPRGRRITAMFSFYGQLLIWTETSLWSLHGQDVLSDFQLRNISMNIGCVAPRAVARVSNDLLWISNHGVHSLATTLDFGDLEEKFVSIALRNRWHSDSSFDLGRVTVSDHSTLVHVPHYNRTYVGVPLSGDADVERIFELNHSTNQWMGPWNVPARAAEYVLLGYPGAPLLFVGDENGRVGFVNDDRRMDWGADAYNMKIRTGRLGLGDLVRFTKNWVELRLYILARALGPIRVTIQADGHPRVDSETYDTNVYEDDHADDDLVLDSDSEIIDSERVGVLTIPTDMRGKWCQVTIEQGVADQDFLLAGLEFDFTRQQDDKENK